MEQKLVTVKRYCGEYHNFFFVPGSIDSMSSMIKEGWVVKEIISNDSKAQNAVILFERKKNA